MKGSLPEFGMFYLKPKLMWSLNWMCMLLLERTTTSLSIAQATATQTNQSKTKDSILHSIKQWGWLGELKCFNGLRLSGKSKAVKEIRPGMSIASSGCSIRLITGNLINRVVTKIRREWHVKRKNLNVKRRILVNFHWIKAKLQDWISLLILDRMMNKKMR